jgi:hypothetical protein
MMTAQRAAFSFSDEEVRRMRLASAYRQKSDDPFKKVRDRKFF